MPPEQQFVEIAKLAGLQQWAAHARRAVGQEQHACLANEAEIDQLVQMNGDVDGAISRIPGTPAFVINGKLARADVELGSAGAASCEAALGS